MRILIADDHELFLKGLEFVLQSHFPEAKIITASDYKEAFSVLENLHDFSLIITDLAMPGVNSLNGIEKIKKLANDAPVVILSAVFDQDAIQKTLEMGVSGYILKASSNSEIINALKVVLDGKVYIPKDFSAVESVIPQQPLEQIDKSSFSERQLEVLQKIVEGLSNKQIAHDLSLSEGTVKFYITSILKKLNVLNRTAAGLKAVKLGLVSSKK